MALLISVFCAGAAYADRPHYTIATGSKGATFYPLADAMCRIVNKAQDDFSCDAVSTDGSVSNLKALAAGEYDFGVAQAHLAYSAFSGTGDFSGAGKKASLRTVLPLHTEIMVGAVRHDAHIDAISDLPGKRVNIGNEGSGSILIARRILQRKGVTETMFKETHYLKSAGIGDALCENRIDAALYAVGHPNAIFHAMLSACDVTLISVLDSDIAQMVAQDSRFSLATIPKGTYPRMIRDIEGPGIQAALFAGASVDPEHLSSFIRIVKAHKDALEKEHDVFKYINFSLNDGVKTVPLHRGALPHISCASQQELIQTEAYASCHGL